MASLSVDIRICTANNEIVIDDNCTSIHKYYDTTKKYKSRGMLCKPETKWLNNLNSQLQNMEIYTDNLTILTMLIDQCSGDIIALTKDFSLSSNTKLSSSTSVYDVVVAPNFLVLSYNDVSVIEMLSLSSARIDEDKMIRMMRKNGGKVKPNSLFSSFLQILAWNAAGTVQIYFPGSFFSSDTLLAVESTSSQSHVCKYNFQQAKLTCFAVIGRLTKIEYAWPIRIQKSSSLTLTGVLLEAVKVLWFVLISSVRWYSNNSIIIAVSGNGDMQFYDIALNTLQVLFNGANMERLTLPSSVLPKSANMSSFELNTKHPQQQNKISEFVDAAVLAMENGPVVMVMISKGILGHDNDSRQIFNNYIRCGMINEALELIHSLDWSFEPSSMYYCLSSFIHHLLSSSSVNDDVIALVQSCLSKFYSPANKIPEFVAIEYGKPMNDLARKFFRFLLSAKANGETALADSSRRRGFELAENDFGFKDFEPDDRDDVQSLDSMDNVDDDDDNYGDNYYLNYDDNNYNYGNNYDNYNHNYGNNYATDDDDAYNDDVVVSQMSRILLRSESLKQVLKQQEAYLSSNEK
ncbi:hypothetical protein HELRODRAFT_179229 [Helobdella robusta]|uniref:Uncharacterized protein n=1 Tax=Helobdella robusta TaxID=6412 RepID=T1FEE1_HELRO|nr:hypothetical protein HELRODRAFT_179229 [Helobdella robusta]ESN95461.1 hypothetical protein HELRODRAFT_179229 [Helobdella robusta]